MSERQLGEQFPGNETFATNNTEGGEWIEHDGSDCPLKEEKDVQVRNRVGQVITAPSWIVKWSNVASYRIVEA